MHVRSWHAWTPLYRSVAGLDSCPKSLVLTPRFHALQSIDAAPTSESYYGVYLLQRASPHLSRYPFLAFFACPAWGGRPIRASPHSFPAPSSQMTPVISLRRLFPSICSSCMLLPRCTSLAAKPCRRSRSWMPDKQGASAIAAGFGDYRGARPACPSIR